MTTAPMNRKTQTKGGILRLSLERVLPFERPVIKLIEMVTVGF
jgi:hypothetical protein